MIAPLYRVRVDWGGAQGAFRVGVSKIGGPDVIISSADFTGTFGSPYSDVSEETTAGKIQRKMGADGICEGTLDLTLNDSWPGKFNAKNSDSVLYGQIRPGLRGEVEVSFDSGATWSPIYNGWLNESESDPDYGKNQARINFTDLAYLERAIDPIPSTGPISVADALGLVHDAIGWQGARNFAGSGDMLADFSTDAGATGRDAIAAILKVNLGSYYVSAGFVATYVDRYEYARRASAVTVQSVGASVPGVALSTVVNRATATGPSGTPQVYEDGTSRGRYGPLADTNGDVQSDWFSDDDAALSNAKWRVYTQRDPVGPYWQFQPMPSDDATLEACVVADMLDIVTVEPVGLSGEDQQLQWVTHDFGGGQAHVVTWRLRELPATKPLLVGSGHVGGPEVVAP